MRKIETEEGTPLTLPMSERDHIQGLSNAPLTLVEYGDYQCPYCGAAYPVVKQLQKTLGEVFNREERNIRYFLTVPAIWNDAGKAATRAAAIQAGFLRDENDPRLTLITEPEAAAMFCSKTGLLNLRALIF